MTFDGSSTGSRTQMLRTSTVVGAFSLVGSVTGILVDTAIAAKLGLSRGADIFYVAFTIPYIITNLLSATSQFSLVPFFSALAPPRTEPAGGSLPSSDGPEQLGRGFSYASSIVFLSLSSIAVAGALAAPWLVRGIAPGLSASDAAVAGRLCRWLFFVIIPAGLAEVLRSYLLSRRIFALPSAANFFRNAVVIVAVLAGFRRLGLASLVLGYTAGYVVQFVALAAYAAARAPVRFRWRLTARGEAFRNLRGAGTAQVSAAVAWQGVVVAERIIASFLPAGAITALNWGMRIMSTLAELLAGSVGTAALPGLSEAAARAETEEQRRTFRHTLEISLLLVTPVAVDCLLLDRGIIRLIYERGSFTPEATVMMATVLWTYSLALLPFAFIRVLSFQLFARNEAHVFLRLSLFFYGLVVAFDLLYVGGLRLGTKGIPLGLLTSALITGVLAVRRNVSDLIATLNRPFARLAAKNALAAGLAALAVWAARAWWPAPPTSAENFVFLCVACGAGGAVFLAALAASRAVSLRQMLTAWSRSN